MHLGLDARRRQGARTAGVVRPRRRRSIPIRRLLLGAVDLSPYQVAQMYQYFAADGHALPLRALRGVVDAQGKAADALRREGRRRQLHPARAPGHLRDAAGRRRPAPRMRSPIRAWASLHAAGKTGTSDSQRDSWFAGFTGSHLAVVWVGRDDNQANRPVGRDRRVAGVDRHCCASCRARRLALPQDGLDQAYVNPQSGAAHRCAMCRRAQLPFMAGFVPQDTDHCVLAGDQVDPWRWPVKIRTAARVAAFDLTIRSDRMHKGIPMKFSALMIRPAICACLLLAACTQPPAKVAPPARDPVAAVTAIRAAGAKLESSVEVKPLRDPAVDGLLKQAHDLEAQSQPAAALEAVRKAEKIARHRAGHHPVRSRTPDRNQRLETGRDRRAEILGYWAPRSAHCARATSRPWSKHAKRWAMRPAHSRRASRSRPAMCRRRRAIDTGRWRLALASLVVAAQVGMFLCSSYRRKPESHGVCLSSSFRRKPVSSSLILALFKSKGFHSPAASGRYFLALPKSNQKARRLTRCSDSHHAHHNALRFSAAAGFA